MKKTYVSPRIELICFAPVENLATGNKSWIFNNHWGILGDKANDEPQNVSGIINWYSDLESKLTSDLEE